MLVVVNDEEIENLEFKPTGSWIERWVFVGIKAKIKPGANIIELRTNGKSGPNINELLIL